MAAQGRHKRVLRPRGKLCPNEPECRFVEGECATCGFKLVETTRDKMLEKDLPRR